MFQMIKKNYEKRQLLVVKTLYEDRRIIFRNASNCKKHVKMMERSLYVPAFHIYDMTPEKADLTSTF